MADDLDFESFDNLDDLDWSELEKGVKTGAAPEAGGPAPSAGGAPAPAKAGGGETPALAEGDAQIGIAYLLDVGLQVSVEVGRRLYFISDILSWDPGSIIELDRIVGEPLHLLINGKPVATGEVVVANDKFALRITEILDPNDRLQMLQS